MSDKRRILFTDNAKFAVAKPEGKPVTLTGYALVWNALSSDRGFYKVRLLPNSAQFVRPTLALYHHDFRAIIGSTENGTLRLTPDAYGVKTEIDLPDTSTARDVAELVGKGFVRGMSFALTKIIESTESTEDGETILNLAKFEADEVTVTAVPAFSDTSIAVKPDAPGDYSTRTAHRHRLEKLRLDALRLPSH